MDEKLVKELLEAAEDMLGSEPDMPGHEATYSRLSRAVDACRSDENKGGRSE